MLKLGKLNTLRNQIFLGFLTVMFIVLATVGVVIFDQVSAVLRSNAEKHIQQTAVQATGKLDALLKQMDTLMAQIATNASTQWLLSQSMDGMQTTFQQRQALQQEVRKFEAFATGIRSIDLYTRDYQGLLPLDTIPLTSRMPQEWMEQVEREKGRLVWFGIDPYNSDVVIAARSIRLMDRSFSHGGYLTVRIDKSYFEFIDAKAGESGTRELMALFDSGGHMIASDFVAKVDAAEMFDQEQQTIQVEGKTYIPIRQEAATTGWTLVILTPSDYAVEGISVLRTAIIVAGLIGGLLFLIMTFILSTMITRPILNLIRAMRSSKMGTLQPSTVTTQTMEINELNNTYNQLVVHLNELIEVVYEKEITQSRTELKALQAQINPHFLFNTLEAFYWSLDEKGEEELAEIVVAMSGIFRYVINRTDEEEWVTIGDELDHAERYLKIMKMRMLDRLTWHIDVDAACRQTAIPKLLIQPLVENAILHGVEKRRGQGVVRLTVRRSAREGFIYIAVKDDGPGMSDEQLKQLDEIVKGASKTRGENGIGMANVQKRLQLSFPAETAGLVIASKSGEGTTVSFEIPINRLGEREQ